MMWSQTLDKISRWSLLLTLSLLPIFFLPYSRMPVEVSKGLLFVVGLVISLVFYLAARFSDGKMSAPRSPLLLAGLGVVLVTLLSALFSSSRGMSFFGTIFDLGSFWFILAGFVAFLLASLSFQSQIWARKLIFGLLVASALVLVFQALRFFIPAILSFGILGDKSGNLIGSWYNLGIFAGFTTILSLLLLEFFDLKRVYKILVSGLALLSIIFVFLVNLPLVWGLVGVFALLVLIYKLSLLKGGVERKNFFPLATFIVVLCSLLFLTSGKFIFGVLPERLRVQSPEVRPTFSSTFAVGKSALLKDPLLGAGPNRFADAWAMYKPAQINSSSYWNATFDSGVGTIPTIFSTVGALGILAWLSFFAFFLYAGARSLLAGLKESFSTEGTFFFTASFFLFTASFFYPLGSALFILAVVLSGVFLALSAGRKIEISFFVDPRKSFFAISLLVIILGASVVFGFKYLERFAAATFFTRTLSATTVPSAETAVTKTVSLYSNDLYLRTYSQVYLLKLNSLAEKTTLTTEEQAELQNVLKEAINGATAATEFNKDNYVNFQTLGAVYDTLGSLGVPSAFSKAVEAYASAEKLNPLNPAIKLALSRDYQALGDAAAAVGYAEAALALLPDNKEIKDYLDTLRDGKAL
ncbi:MAG: hypothetical protein AAB500_00445 [Patescibacteria group bacterium]